MGQAARALLAKSGVSCCCHTSDLANGGDMFEAFGVSALAETAYRALVRDATMGMADLATLLSIDKSDARALVDELTSSGLLVPGGADEITVVPPERALETLIDREQAALERRRLALDGLRDDVGGLVAEFVDSRRHVIGDMVEAIRGPEAVRSRLYQLSREATASAWTLNPGLPMTRDSIAASKVMDAQSRARGVRGKAVFSVATVADPDNAAYLAETVEAGDEVRIHPAPPMRLLLIDNRTAVIPLDPTSHARGAYVLHGEALVAPLRILFELVWAASSRLGDAAAAATDPEQARLRMVVALLADGHKDEAIARRVGVSVRTVRRLIATAIARLQAESRFQAGALAVRRGWVSAEDRDPVLPQAPADA
jgi:DNA-binding CsgD family transcriptional regulator